MGSYCCTSVFQIRKGKIPCEQAVFFYHPINCFWTKGKIRNEGILEGVWDKKEAPSGVLCLFNVHYGRWAWAAGEMPIAQQAVIRENVDLVHKLAPCAIRTLSNIYFLCLSGVLLLCKHRRVSCPLAASCIYLSLPLSPFSFCSFFPIVILSEGKTPQGQGLMFLVLLQLWQKDFSFW